jgi:hypothetical protein
VLSACATSPPVNWVKADGKAPTELQFELDQTACRGEMQKANLSSPAEPSFGYGRAMADVLAGCMAQRGYVRRVGPAQ